jgi:hypothetical protein
MRNTSSARWNSTARRSSQSPRIPGAGRQAEMLEPRTFLHAGPTAAFADVPVDGVTAGGTQYWFKVVYSDGDDAVNVGTIGNGDVQVTGPDGYSQPGTLSNLARVNGDWEATYRVPAPGGTWDFTDNGIYTVSMQPDQVADTTGDAVDESDLGTRFVDFDVPTEPTASSAADDILVSGGTNYWFKVTYSDNDQVDYRTIDGKDVTVTGPGGYSQSGALANLTYADSDWTATYRITAPGGTWNRADNGLYTISMGADEVRDTSGNPVAAGELGQFAVKLVDRERPTATLVAKDVDTAGGINYWFQVKYTDDTGIDYRTIDGNDVQVTGPGGFTASGALSNLVFAGDSATVTYRISPPGGAWDAADNGSYTVLLKPSQVADTSGNFAVTKSLGAFAVSIPQPVAPAATGAALNLFSGVSIVDQTLGL